MAQSKDCFITQDRHWFRYRAAAIIRQGDSILMVTNPSVDYLYSVGGAVQLGETAQQAVVREVLEETGIHMEVERLAAIHENFFCGYLNEYGCVMDCHEVALYFLMKPADLRSLQATGLSMYGYKERLVWVPMPDFGKANIHPAFLPQVFDSNEVLHFVSREDQENQ